jgi:hypothetical protein
LYDALMIIRPIADLLADLAWVGQQTADNMLASPQQLVALVAMILAVAMVMAGALMRTMVPLR